MSDTDLMGCAACKGQGKLIGLGYMQENCHNCKGIGWVEICSKPVEPVIKLCPENSAIAEQYDLAKNDILPKKRGRPKQIKADI